MRRSCVRGPDTVHQRLIDEILIFASTNRMPAMYQLRDVVERGGLVSYGASIPDLFRSLLLRADQVIE